jgi:hypothetical protein
LSNLRPAPILPPLRRPALNLQPLSLSPPGPRPPPPRLYRYTGSTSPGNGPLG